jgi:hypothetical protein
MVTLRRHPRRRLIALAACAWHAQRPPARFGADGPATAQAGRHWKEAAPDRQTPELAARSRRASSSRRLPKGLDVPAAARASTPLAIRYGPMQCWSWL